MQLSIVIVILALAGFYAFLKNKFDEISFANILLVLLLLILMFDYSSNNTYLFAIMSFCILAGFGIDNLLFRHYKSAAVEPLEEFDSDIPEEFLAHSSESVVSEVPSAPAQVPVLDEEPVKTEDIVKTAEDSAAVDEKAKADEASEEIPLKREVPKFFETPLPMPKKHVKKTLDYTFEPSEELMKYDIEISPDDDFDIK